MLQVLDPLSDIFVAPEGRCPRQHHGRTADDDPLRVFLGFFFLVSGKGCVYFPDVFSRKTKEEEGAEGSTIPTHY